jgi:hypothetical protein
VALAYFLADAWNLLRAALLILPIVAYVGFSIFTVIWAMGVGDPGLKQNMTFQAKFYFYHGMAVVLTIVLAAAGSFVTLFALTIGGLLNGLAR